MKKMLLLSVMAGMALTGCVKNEVYVSDIETQGTKIAFESPFLYGNKTKAVYGELNDKVYPKNEKFIIFAAQHQGDFDSWPTTNVTDSKPLEDGLCLFNCNVLEYDANFDAWVPYKMGDDDKKDYYYWPQGMKLTYAAMSPSEIYNENVTYGATGLEIKDYTNPDVGSQYDILFAKREYNKTAGDMSHNASEYSGVPISFQHALTSLHFSIDKETIDQDVRLIKLTLKGIKNKGTFTENIDDSSGSSYIIDNENENVNTVDPVWQLTNDSVDYVPFNSGYTDADTNFDKALPFPVTPRYISDVLADLKKDGAYESATSHSLLVIPQEITDAVELLVDYSISGTKQSKTYKLQGLTTLTEGGIDNGIEGSISSWKRGHKYTYRIHYSASSEMKDIIYFGPSVDGWKDVQVIQITL